MSTREQCHCISQSPLWEPQMTKQQLFVLFVLFLTTDKVAEFEGIMTTDRCQVSDVSTVQTVRTGGVLSWQGKELCLVSYAFTDQRNLCILHSV
jgi:hypothetical protein